jgi:hypothetical protein
MVDFVLTNDYNPIFDIKGTICGYVCDVEGHMKSKFLPHI